MPDNVKNAKDFKLLQYIVKRDVTPADYETRKILRVNNEDTICTIQCRLVFATLCNQL